MILFLRCRVLPVVRFPVTPVTTQTLSRPSDLGGRKNCRKYQSLLEKSFTSGNTSKSLLHLDHVDVAKWGIDIVKARTVCHQSPLQFFGAVVTKLAWTLYCFTGIYVTDVSALLALMITGLPEVNAPVQLGLRQAFHHREIRAIISGVDYESGRDGAACTASRSLTLCIANKSFLTCRDIHRACRSRRIWSRTTPR
ncbi:hypothetical protein EJ03DRAFT_91825 [Teratosphaeria nubilosa]|uniref:Uncharacterized protein n=1 Tax=Teratosphaeria nubilosa TaxID=161662 RepID=A0A6G1LBT5_9PEZI|nr:hypothetical protein EJ03DRAFT_91825 [Teratosphaeria nubilosa]